MTDPSMHPDTGKPDKVRADPEWRAKIEEIEYNTGYTICGSRCSGTGLPCMRRPPRGEHRCIRHMNLPHVSSPEKRSPVLPYSPNVKWGMKLNTFTVCRLCKDTVCEHRVCAEHASLAVIGYQTDPETGEEVPILEDDTCPIEQSIYHDVMRLADDYGLDDTLQDSMLESVAFAFIHRFRAERHIAHGGMVMSSVAGFTRDGRPLYETKEHPLLKHVLKLNDTIIKFSDALGFSPKAQSRMRIEEESSENEQSLVTMLIQKANEERKQNPPQILGSGLNICTKN